jgi:TonB family protein
MTQRDLCCRLFKGGNPVYPREARLAHIEGVVKLVVVFAKDGSIEDVRPVSGDRVLMESALEAVRQWRIQPVLLNGEPQEAEMSLIYTFSIHDPPEPAYLHLTNGDVIRADSVREFTDRIEYTVGRRTQHISPDSVTAISGCGPVTDFQAGCIAGGGASFDIRAFPLIPADRDDASGHSGGTPPFGATPSPGVSRLHLEQNQLNVVSVVSPIYPIQARLTHTEGIVHLFVIIANSGLVADVHVVSGDPLLTESAIEAIRQWRLQPFVVTDHPQEGEVYLTFTFAIEDFPKPAYIHLASGEVIRADEVREFTDGIEYEVGGLRHRISADSVRYISWCGQDCVPGGGLSYNIRAFPLLP